ncbi:MAG: hypothetical protein B6245_23710 [Desulfobacteraceae bacterium 4572_88]|nr:MAG: hypothetical protein B6245_23710 [Desulfobacteraceae bacterium 4572_88]
MRFFHDKQSVSPKLFIFSQPFLIVKKYLTLYILTTLFYYMGNDKRFCGFQQEEIWNLFRRICVSPPRQTRAFPDECASVSHLGGINDQKGNYERTSPHPG